MSETVKRSYESTLRDAQARRTRRQIVAAAGRLYEQHGFVATTVDAIAAEAGVSRKTVFTSVGGKVALLKLAYDYAMAGDDEPIPMIERDGLQRIIAEPDPYEQMRLYAALVTETGGRIGGLWVALRGAAEVDAEARELYTRWEQERRDSMRTGPVPDLMAKGALRSAITPDEAADILSILVDPALYQRLVVDAGWSAERFRDWLNEAFLTQILRPRAEVASGRFADLDLGGPTPAGGAEEAVPAQDQQRDPDQGESGPARR